MPFEITMPQLGLTMETGSVVEWLIQEGEAVTKGQEIFTVETDKSIVAVESYHDGKISQILIQVGQEVPVGTVLAVGTVPGEEAASHVHPQLHPVEQPAALTETISPPLEPAQFVSPTQAVQQLEGPIQASWKARAMARQAGLDLRTISGSGPNGRITAQDIATLPPAKTPAQPVEASATPIAANLAAALGIELANIPGSGTRGKITREDVISAAAAIIQQKAAGLISSHQVSPM